MEFTKEELAELTTFNALAFDLARVNSGSTKIPCWLCTDEYSKTKYRQDMVEHLNKLKVTIIPLTIDSVDRIITRDFEAALAGQVEKWRQGELNAKKARLEGSPVAFFA